MFRVSYFDRIILRFPIGVKNPLLRRITTVESTTLKDEYAKALPFNEIPGLSKFELVKRFMVGGKFHNVDLSDVFRSLRAELGDFYRLPGIFGQTDTLTTYDADDVEFVHRNEGIWPYRRGFETLSYFRREVRPDIYSQGGLIVEQGSDWKKSRTAANPILMQPKIVKSYIPVIDNIVSEFITNIPYIQDDKGEMPGNFCDYLNRWSLESITAVSLEKRLGLMDFRNVNVFGERVAKVARKIFTIGVEFEFQPSIWKIYQTKRFKELMGAFNELTELSATIINEAKEKLETGALPNQEDSILSKLIQKDKNFATVMAFDMILGGIDTTASAMSSAIYCLAKHPEKQARLRRELEQVMPQKDTPLNGDIMNNMPYLRAVLKETLRLFPPAAMNMRRTSEKLIFRGYQIPENVDIILAMIHLYKDPKYFDKPNEFIPERWLRHQTEETDACPQSLKLTHKFSFLPFGFGTRFCVGKRIADMELEVFVSKLFRNYKVEWNYPDIKTKSLMVNIPDGELRFKMTKI